MHKLFEPELLSGSLESQANEAFHYPTSRMIGGGIPKVDLLPDDLQVLVAADETLPLAIHTLKLEKSRHEQAELEVKSARLKLLRELTNRLASNHDLDDLLREVTGRMRPLILSDFALLGLLDMESGRLQVNAFDLPDDIPLDEEALGVLAGVLGAQVLDTGKPWTGTSGELARVDATRVPLWVSAGMQRVCVLPLMSRGQALGILAAGRPEGMAYKADEIDFLIQVSSQLAAAIQSAVLLGE
jgi:transcriptional regulator with GAF, ATPase, and Fis domain